MCIRDSCEIEMTGLTRQQAAEAVASLFGTTAVHSHSSRTYDPWEVTDNEGKTWRFVYDSSIHGSHRIGRQLLAIGDSAYKVEMNSPKLEYREMPKLQEVVRTLRHAGAVVNESCGMHVHVNASKHTPQSLKNALSIMYSKEDILFKALNVNEHRVEPVSYTHLDVYKRQFRYVPRSSAVRFPTFLLRRR